MIITRGGKTVDPQPIEIRLKESTLIEEAIVVGDGRKYLTVLIEPSAELAGRVRAELDRVNADLARVEQLKDFRVLPRPLEAARGERTANGKVKRAAVVGSFAGLIDEMYGVDDERSRITCGGRARGVAAALLLRSVHHESVAPRVARYRSDLVGSLFRLPDNGSAAGDQCGQRGGDVGHLERRGGNTVGDVLLRTGEGERRSARVEGGVTVSVDEFRGQAEGRGVEPHG